MKHTKGEWNYGDSHLFGKETTGVYTWIDENRICISECSFESYRMAFKMSGEKLPEYLSKETEISNAKLIASAPELLKELKESRRALLNLAGEINLYLKHGIEMDEKILGASMDSIQSSEKAIKKATD